MRTILLLAISALISLALSGQEMDSLQKARMGEMMKEMELRQKELQPRPVSSFSEYFRPELIDTFFTYLQQERYDKLYEGSDSYLQKLQSKEDLIKYFKAIGNIYGKLEGYAYDSYSIRDQWMSINKAANAVYKAEFRYARAKVSTAFNIIDSATIKLTSFQVATEDYTPVKTFDSLAKPTFDLLNAKDYAGLYNSTSSRFRDYTPIAKYEEFTDGVDGVDFKKCRLYRNQIGVVHGQLIYYLVYEINEGKGYLTLTYTETEKGFLLEGINYEPNGKK